MRLRWTRNPETRRSQLLTSLFFSSQNGLFCSRRIEKTKIIQLQTYSKNLWNSHDYMEEIALQMQWTNSHHYSWVAFSRSTRIENEVLLLNQLDQLLLLHLRGASKKLPGDFHCFQVRVADVDHLARFSLSTSLRLPRVGSARSEIRRHHFDRDNVMPIVSKCAP